MGRVNRPTTMQQPQSASPSGFARVAPHRRRGAVCLTVLALVLMGCDRGEPARGPGAEKPAQEAARTEVAVYEATIRRIATQMDRPGTGIAILNGQCGEAAKPKSPFACPKRAMAPGVRRALQDRLADLGAVDWVETRADVPAFGDPAATGNGVLIVLGPVQSRGGHVSVGWSAYTLPMGGRGETDQWMCPQARCAFAGVTGDGAWIS